MSLEILDTHKGRRVDGERTICEEHRAVADLLVAHLADRPEALAAILERLNTAYLMGIRLVNALIERKLALPQWEKNNVAEASALRKERVRLLAIIHHPSSIINDYAPGDRL